MRFTVTFLGLDLLDVSFETTPAPCESDEPGDCTTFPIGFSPSPGDQRWDTCADYGE